MSATTPFVEYVVTTPAQDTFVVPFQFWQKDDLEVKVDDVTTTAFAVTGAEDPAGGEVILNTAVSNATVSIQRFTEQVRSTDFPIAGPFRIEQLNEEFNRIIAMLNDVTFSVATEQVDWNSIINTPDFDALYVNTDGDQMTSALTFLNGPSIGSSGSGSVIDPQDAGGDKLIYDDTTKKWHLGATADASNVISTLSTSVDSEEQHNPDGSGYRIVGGTLECWGTVSSATSGDTGVTFPKTFQTLPSVNLTALDTALDTEIRVSALTDLTTTGFRFKTRRIEATSLGGTSTNVRWHATGQWNGV